MIRLKRVRKAVADWVKFLDRSNIFHFTEDFRVFDGRFTQSKALAKD